MDPCVAVVALDGRHLFVTALIAYSTRVNWAWVGRYISIKND